MHRTTLFYFDLFIVTTLILVVSSTAVQLMPLKVDNKRLAASKETLSELSVSFEAILAPRKGDSCAFSQLVSLVDACAEY